MNNAWGRAAAVMSIAAVLLSGCGDDAEPGASPTPTASTSAASPSTSASGSPSASASPSTNPSVPAAARARTEDGAIAFLEFYFDLINDGYKNPKNPPNLFAYSDKGCVACKKTQDRFDVYAQEGEHLKGPLIRRPEASLATAVTAEKVLLNASLTYDPVEVLTATGTTGEFMEAEKVQRTIALKWVNNAWLLFDME